MNHAFAGASHAVTRVRDCSLHVVAEDWAFALENAEAIDAHWARRSRENATYFNGIIHLMRRSQIEAGMFHGEFLRTDFKSYLYWRETGFPPAEVLDGFGSALIRSGEGHIVLGRQRAGNINSGLTYLPGGFIDERDVGERGVIDIEGSILREVQEETGLSGGDYLVQPGYILTLDGPMLSMAREIVSPLPAEGLRRRILDHFAGDTSSELTDAVIVRAPEDIDGAAAPMHPYAQRLLRRLLGQGGFAG